MRTIDDLDLVGTRVLLRVDINSPLDPATGLIADEARIEASIPTIRDLADGGARLTIIAHQGDTLDYHNLVSMREHAAKLAEKLDRPVGFIDDIAGPAARERIAALGEGDILLLDNLRFLTEEVSTFEGAVKLTPHQMTATYLVRNLAPLFDVYVNDAFAAAHRNAPSMVAFQELLPSAGGRLLVAELDGLSAVAEEPERPCLFVLGGLKISDAFAMLRKVLAEGIADEVLTAGVVGQVFLLASGVSLGEGSERFIVDRSLDVFIPEAAEYLDAFPDQVRAPLDVAVERNGSRIELTVTDLPVVEPIIDTGAATMAVYGARIAAAATVFVNGPPGVYEREVGAAGTRHLWRAVAAASGTSVIGGGDTVSSARRFVDLDRIDFVSTGGGALIRYLSGEPLPLLEAMERSVLA